MTYQKLRDRLSAPVLLAWVTALCVLCALIGCKSDFPANISFEEGCWSISDTLRMEVEATLESLPMEVYVHFLPTYAYTNLQMKILTTAPDGRIAEFPFQSTVLSPMGDWLLERVGKGYPLRLKLAQPVQTPQSGLYRIALIHNMREDLVCDISSIGIRIDPAP